MWFGFDWLFLPFHLSVLCEYPLLPPRPSLFRVNTISTCIAEHPFVVLSFIDKVEKERESRVLVPLFSMPDARVVRLRDALRLAPGAYPQCALCGIVASVEPLRRREFSAGVVVDFVLREPRAGDVSMAPVTGPERAASDTAPSAVAVPTVRVFAFDAWARALAFAQPGDEVTLHGIAVARPPSDVALSGDGSFFGDVVVAASGASGFAGSGGKTSAAAGAPAPRGPVAAAALAPEAAVFFQPLPAVSRAVVAQTAAEGDVIEFLVSPEDFENPTARVRRPGIGRRGPGDGQLANDIAGGRTVHE